MTMALPGGFLPHGMCFEWQANVLALHVVSDALIALAYFSIPLVLVLLVRRRPDLPFSAVFWMFSIFIVSCGTTHVLSIVVIWHPVYWLEGAVKALTAVSSIGTALALVPLLPRALALRTPAELDRLNHELETTLHEREELVRRLQREHHVASTLQAAALGNPPRRLAGFELDAVYQPGSGDLEIGGDWYDAFAMPDGRVVISVGDVTGKGLAASLVMAKMRQAVRIAAQVQVDPVDILDAADKALRAEEPDAIVTAFVAILDRVERTIMYASAGHHPPVLRAPDGSLRRLESGGLPLGLWTRDLRPATKDVALEPGALLVLYTDGLVEATRDYGAGERSLTDAIADPLTAASEHPAAVIYDRVHTGAVRDDVAVLAIRVPEFVAQGERVWHFASGEPEAAHAVLGEIVSAFRARGARSEETFAVEIVFSELLGNVVRYAPGPLDVQLEWNGDLAVLHVLDRGPGFRRLPRLPSDLMAESGRGLYLVDALAEEFHITRRPSGGSHARVVLSAGSRRGTPLGKVFVTPLASDG